MSALMTAETRSKPIVRRDEHYGLLPKALNLLVPRLSLLRDGPQSLVQSLNVAGEIKVSSVAARCSSHHTGLSLQTEDRQLTRRSQKPGQRAKDESEGRASAACSLRS